MAKVVEHFENNPYICSNMIECPGVEIYQAQKIYCRSPISPHYYSLKHLDGYKLICAHCLTDEKPIENGKIVLCEDCDRKIKK